MTAKLSFFFAQVSDQSRETFNLLADGSNFFLGFSRLLLEILLKFIVFILVFLESLAALIEFLLLHDDVLLQELRLFGLVVD